jgi:hypothetical protein
MSVVEDPFETLAPEESLSGPRILEQRAAPFGRRLAGLDGALIARFHGFDIDDRPQIANMPGRLGEIVAARSTIPLSRRDTDAQVVVLLEQGDPNRPVVVGMLQETHATSAQSSSEQVSIEADAQRFVVTAEREIELRCGDASITLTRTGKIIIKGNYILSHATGYNKIKGAAVDIN